MIPQYDCSFVSPAVTTYNLILPGVSTSVSKCLCYCYYGIIIELVVTISGSLGMWRSLIIIQLVLHNVEFKVVVCIAQSDSQASDHSQS